MHALFPAFGVKRGIREYSWYGNFQPTPITDIYKVRIHYHIDDTPDVKVLFPKLERRASGESIPHLYSRNRLCLYKPGTGQWDTRMFLAETIVPWTSLWLYYYEMWHNTGEWLGGGEHPPEKLSAKVPDLSHQEQ